MKIALYIAFHNKSSIDCCKDIIGLISVKNKLVIDSKIKKSSRCNKIKDNKKGGCKYLGTSEKRLKTIHNNISLLTINDLNGRWNYIREKLLFAGGLKNEYRTSHIFNDYNHCDLTPIKKDFFENENKGKVENINKKNYLGNVINECSINNNHNFTDNDGSWGTCMIGCGKNPPQDVAHIQFQSKIAFKLIWLPPEYDKFALVDDDGKIIKTGENFDKNFPNKYERQMNFEIVNQPSSKYIKNLNINK